MVRSWHLGDLSTKGRYLSARLGMEACIIFLQLGSSVSHELAIHEARVGDQNWLKNAQISSLAKDGTVWPPSNSHHRTGWPSSQPS